MKSHRFSGILLIFMLLWVSACSARLLPQPSGSTALPLEKPKAAETTVPINPTPGLPETLVEFHVQISDDTPTTDSVFLTILDEVTGLYLNAQSYPMTLDQTTGIYSLQLPFPVGSVIKYRYERQGDELRVAEHTSDGSPVRYRMFAVNGPGGTNDVVSRWTDTTYSLASGRILGQATDVMSRKPIPNLLISAGGAQTYTTSDGSFLIEGLPPGIHNLVGYALDGSYRVFQQGAEIAADSTTPTPIQLSPAPLVNVTFEVTPPSNTPPVVPMRLAGNLYQLGNTFGTLTGGVSTLATRMPVLAPLSDGRYQLSLQLPAGADIRYKYTLGDGYWNAEHTSDGAFKLRQFIVPEKDTSLQDTVDTWQTNPGATVTFDLTVPENTPAGDFVSIQMNPLFGWTEPIPMWSLGGNRWAYVLYSPLNLPGNLSYRYCRNNQCGAADDAATPGVYGAGKSVNLDQLPQSIKESVTAWVGLDQPIDPATIPAAEVNPRSENFIAGIEFQPAYHPSWQPLLPQTLQRVKDTQANWLVLDPTWSVTRANPPVLEPVAGQDALWPDLVDSIQKAHTQGLKVALKPTPSFRNFPAPTCIAAPCPSSIDYWWQTGARDFSWWLVWFDYYRNFIIHNADLAAQTGAEALVLGGDWLNPALPGGPILAGQPSGVPADAEQRWRNLLTEVRTRYSGTLIWALTNGDGQIVPPFMDAVDQIYLEWPVDPASLGDPLPPVADLEAQLGAQLDGKVKELQTSSGKPLSIALRASSNAGMESQQNIYQALLNAINQRDWISGIISSGYYPPAALQDQTTSVHGKSAEALLQNWFPGLTGQQP
jgi:hypothetical protein